MQPSLQIKKKILAYYAKSVKASFCRPNDSPETP